MSKKHLISFLVILSIVFTAVICSCEAEDAKFEVNNLIIEPSSATTGQTVPVSVEVTNSGGTGGTYNVIFLVNGVEESSKNISLAPGASQTVTFNLTRDTVGEYEIEMAGMKGELTVVDFNEIFEQTLQAMSTIESYHFTCTLEIEISIPEDALSFTEELP
jgi:archaellum component FlaF (FlaF/FlaG flagellin family)